MGHGRQTMTLGEASSIVLCIWGILSWFTHVLTCLNEESWGFLVAGALFFPIGIIHGTGIWFGAF